MDLKLRDRAALVTGASKGIGLAIARALAAEGCHLAICARGEEALYWRRGSCEPPGRAWFPARST